MQKKIHFSWERPLTAYFKGIGSIRFFINLRILFIIPLFLFAAQGAFAGERDKPLWEIGLVGIGGYIPDYPSSNEDRVKGIVLPYLVYRGKIIRAGDKGIARGRIIRSDRVEFDLSLDGSFDTDSDDNLARRGMPDLDYLFEVGPRLQVTLTDHFWGGKVDLEIPARGVMATDFSSLSFKGAVLYPQLAWQQDNLWGTGTRFKISAGPIFATEKFMDYFFEVEPRFATPERPAFNAQGGYLGSEMRLSAIRKIRADLSILGDVKINFYDGSQNDNSPLFRDESSISIRAGLLWAPFRSKQKVSE